MVSRFAWIAVCLLAAVPTASAGMIFTGNGNGGFGGVFSGSNALELTQNDSVINATLARGAGGFNDAMVFYLDTASGGFANTGTFDDTGDGLRRAISGFDGTNRSTVNFATGFDADFAIAMDQNFAGLWSLSGTGSHTFVADLNLSPAGTTTSLTYDFDFNLASIGLAPGDSFDFVGTYLNAGNAFRSDEAFGDGIAAGNPGNTAITFTSANTVVTAVPEPSSFALVAICGGAAYVMRRRKLAKS